MGRVGIVTDSTACIPAELAAQHRIEVIPLYLVFGDQIYQDGMPTHAAEFYQTLRTAPQPPTTAAPGRTFRPTRQRHLTRTPRPPPWSGGAAAWLLPTTIRSSSTSTPSMWPELATRPVSSIPS